MNKSMFYNVIWVGTCESETHFVTEHFQVNKICRAKKEFFHNKDSRIIVLQSIFPFLLWMLLLLSTSITLSFHSWMRLCWIRIHTHMLWFIRFKFSPKYSSFLFDSCEYWFSKWTSYFDSTCSCSTSTLTFFDLIREDS